MREQPVGRTFSSWEPPRRRPPIEPVHSSRQAIALLDEWASPSLVRTQRATEVPYGVPDGFEVRRVRLGEAVPIDELDPRRVYLWTLDEAGTIHLAPETQPGFGITDLSPDGRRLKHGDLTPSVDGLTRGEARMGGKFKVLRDRFDGPRQAEDGAHVWVMDNSSSYVGARAELVDGELLPRPRLHNDALLAVREVMHFGGTDTSHLQLKPKFGSALWRGDAAVVAESPVVGRSSLVPPP